MYHISLIDAYAPIICSLIGYTTIYETSVKAILKKLFWIVILVPPFWEMFSILALYAVQNALFNGLLTINISQYVLSILLYNVLFISPIPLEAYIFSKKFEMSFGTAFSSYLFMYAVETVTLFYGKNALTSIFIYLTLTFYCFFMTRKNLPFLVEHRKEHKSYSSVLYFISINIVISSLYQIHVLRTYQNTYYSDYELYWYHLLALLAFVSMILFHRLDTRNQEANLLRIYESQEKEKYIQRFSEAQQQTIQTLAEVSEAKSGETGKHIKRVAEYTGIIAQSLNMAEKDVDILKTASMLHDLGKLLIPNEILEKPGKLTPEEYQIVKTHTTYGRNLLVNSKGPIMQFARIIAYEHHERWDGSGYPQGLKKEHIHLYAQIVSVVDVFDALTSKRCYKEAWPIEKAKEEIISKKGTHFSPTVVDVFEKNFDKIEEIYWKYQDEPTDQP